MKKLLSLSALALCTAVLLGISTGRVYARLTGTDPGTDVWCVGVSALEVCVDASGNLIPTTTNVSSLGTSSLKFKDLNLAGNSAIAGNESVTGTLTITGGILNAIPATQVVAAGDTIVANACGGLKKISSTGVVSSSTTIPFTTPAAANTGCAMDVLNVGGSSITIKYLAGLGGFNSALGADVVLGSSDTVRVISTGISWFQVGTTGNN